MITEQRINDINKEIGKVAKEILESNPSVNAKNAYKTAEGIAVKQKIKLMSTGKIDSEQIKNMGALLVLFLADSLE